MILATILIASSGLENTASKSITCAGFGASLINTLVIIPNVPSEPTISCVRQYPVESFFNLPPRVVTSPSGVTTSNPNTCCRVVPYLIAFIPPALVATLPPMQELSELLGSPGYKYPFSVANFCTSMVRTPGSTINVILVSSNSTNRVIRSVDKTIPPPKATAAQAYPVPAPLGMIGISRRFASLTISATCSVVSGNTTASGK